MKIVIAGSAKFPNEIQKWIDYWNNQNDCSVLDYPKVIPPGDFESIYPTAYTNFFKNITKADILFVANYRKNDIEGYIGAETFSEMGFALAQKLINGQNIKLILATMPSKEVSCYDEIVLWKKLGWIDDVLT
ncbi:MAG TPA: hypothetical protein PLX10_01105 [Candidatus Paceibacterota bacterium]|nr:hypothetical protein [Candidatus Paceibacterota bacterium]